MSRNATNGRGNAPSTRSPDEDIAALFAAQADDVAVPADLDAVIRASAREAAPARAATAPALDPVRAARADDTRSVGAPLLRHPPRWLAVAAVFALAFALVPLVRQAPGPSDDFLDDASTPAAVGDAGGAGGVGSTTSEDSADSAGNDARTVDAKRSPAARATGEAVGAARSAPVTEALHDLASTADAESAAETPSNLAPRAVRESAPVAAAERLRARPSAAPDADVPTLVTRSSGRGDPLAGADARAAPAPDPFEGHRRTPDAWLERLRERLRIDGFTPALRDEYRRFRSRHPDVEPAFDPEAVAREAEAPRR